jgi:menaquinone-specific isochorismate synthase
MTPAPIDPSRWRAVTRAVPRPSPSAPPWSSAALRRWHDPHSDIWAAGEALRIPLPGGLADEGGLAAVAALLAAIPTDDQVGQPGCGPVALGALPFDPAAPGQLVVPARLIGRRGGVAWETVLTLDGAPLPAAPAHAAGEPPDEFTLVSTIPHAAWRALVAAAVGDLAGGPLEKVVIARCVDVTANRPIVIPDILSRLQALYPTCFIFSMDGFVGASPELLIGRVGGEVTSHPLAGTVARSGDGDADAALVAGLLASPKDRWEHQLVVEALAKDLREVCPTLDVPDAPTVVGLRNVSHLGTRLTGQLGGPPERWPSALELVGRVHPTPAVGGWPQAEAIAYLQQAEGFDRGRYAGPVGWMDRHGDGTWAVGIRCADVDANHARLYAGCGIVGDSDPAAELAEAQLKLQAVLAAVVRP